MKPDMTRPNMKTTLSRQGHKGAIADPFAYTRMMKKLAIVAYRSAFKRILRLKISGRYLDAGCGPGILAGMLAEAMSEITIVCLDISSEMMELAEEHIHALGLANRFDFVIGDVADRATFEGLGEFDLVYSTYALHHWERPRQALQNLWQAVRPGGTLYIVDTRRVWWIRLIPSHDEVTESVKVSFTGSELASLLNQCHIVNPSIEQTFPFFISVTATKSLEH